MRISEIVIENFCSIEKATITPSLFSIFVGQNNHGKTNMFEALAWFYAPGKGDVNNLRFARNADKKMYVEVEFAGVQAGLAQMKNAANRTKIENLVGSSDIIRARRSCGEPKTRKIFDNASQSWLEKNPTGFDPAFNDLLPELEYIPTQIRLTDVSKFGKTTALGSMLSSVLMAILYKSQKYQEFHEKFDQLFCASDSEVRVELDKVSSAVTMYVSKQFPDCTKVEFRITEPVFEELLKSCSTEVDDGIVTDASEKGDGMQRALMLAILQTYADFRKKGEAAGKNFIFLIDEAELHLHPTAQRKLKAALSDIAGNGDQVFINTHSSVLVADEAPNQIIFRTEKSDHRTSISPVKPTHSLEEYYSAAYKKTADEVQGMNGETKIALAREAGDNLSKHQFETDMPAMKAALAQCWKLAYQ